ncbi:hypothetical protein GQ55_4G287100 [Panicum hallii var. hallii]|uniref:Uncharacterized protein n=1 Tax=Panicum hallii var. hallii TaxID=1504633 RepID=A0A2T7E173_9POAL|nr:hypothetical protein GQ55_4G287100 [Panicum hallii var. hallii]
MCGTRVTATINYLSLVPTRTASLSRRSPSDLLHRSLLLSPKCPSELRSWAVVQSRHAAGHGRRPAVERVPRSGEAVALMAAAATEGLAMAPRRRGSGKEHADVRLAGGEAPRPPRRAGR